MAVDLLITECLLFLLIESIGMDRHDLVIYGVTGFTGAKILETLLDSETNVDFAVAGRNEQKIRQLLCRIGELKSEVLCSLICLFFLFRFIC